VPLVGLKNNGAFLRDLLKPPQFASATLTTTRLDEWAAASEPIFERPVAPPGRVAHCRCAARAGRARSGRRAWPRSTSRSNAMANGARCARRRRT